MTSAPLPSADEHFNSTMAVDVVAPAPAAVERALVLGGGGSEWTTLIDCAVVSELDRAAAVRTSTIR